MFLPISFPKNLYSRVLVASAKSKEDFGKKFNRDMKVGQVARAQEGELGLNQSHIQQGLH